MKKYYISSKEGQSGICKYSDDFYELILKPRDFILINSSTPAAAILSQVFSDDIVHIEIGIFQKNEIAILFKMLNSGYKNVSVTLHDAPLIKYPFLEFKNSFLNNVSKFYDLYVSNFRHVGKYLKRIKNIYVLTYKGVDKVKSTYKIANVHFLPHVINESEINKKVGVNNDFIYMGFVGRNKGIEHALQLHQHVLKTFSDIKFYIIGKALGKEIIFYTDMKKKYKQNTFFMGYVPHNELEAVFAKATFSFNIFSNYKFYIPFSGSILYALKKGKIVFTANTNAVSEIIKDGQNGFFLSGILEKDTETIIDILNNKSLLNKISDNVYQYLITNHTPEVVSKYFKN